MRAVKDSLAAPLEGEVGKMRGMEWVACWPPVLAQRARSEGARWTREVGAHLARPQGRRLDTLTMKQWSLDARSKGQPRPLP